MAYIITYLYRKIERVFDENADVRVENFPIMQSVKPMFSVIGIYLLFVLYYGPKWMHKREAFNLKYIMIVYNAIQVVVNLSLLIYGLKFSYLHKDFSWTCQPIDHNNNSTAMRNVLYATYGYYLTKYLDLFDTIVFVLRKKSKQITFLHVYHHAGMIFAVHIHMKFLGGSHSTMLGVINLLIHTVMYAYYFVTSVGTIEQTLWWKRHITQLQLLQFAYLVLHFSISIIYNTCNYPLLISFVGFIQNIFMFVMFFDFYYKAYIKKSKKKIDLKTNLKNQ